MERASYRELKKQPEARDYRKHLASALSVARRYDGSERAYGELFQSLSALEESIETAPSLKGSGLREKEIEAAFAFAPIHPREINDVLAVASASWQRSLHGALAHPEEESGIVVNYVEGVLLPPGVMRQISGDGTAVFEAKFEPRIDEVMQLLKTKKIFADDVIITMGDVRENQMREVSYAAIDIPRLNRMILVCNQVGQATFVLSKRVPVTDLLCVTKSDLPKEFPGTVTRIIRSAQWEKEILGALGDEQAKEKLDVRALDREQLRVAILEKYPTSEAWVRAYRGTESGKKQGLGITVLGRKLVFIAGRFGFPVGHISIEDFLSLSKQIYGDSDEYLKYETDRYGRSAEDWKKEILKIYPTSREFFAAFNAGRGEGTDIDVEGRGIQYLAAQFGISTSQSRKNIAVSLAEQLYGAEDAFVQEKKLGMQERTEDEWCRLIAMKYPTSADWLNAFRGAGGRSQGRDIVVAGKKIIALAQRLGFSEAVRKIDWGVCIRMGLKVYGDSDELLRRELGDRELWKKEILRKYPTSREWLRHSPSLSNSHFAENVIEVLGKRMSFLGPVFGFSTPIRLRDFIKFGALLYGEDDPEIRKELERTEERTSEEWMSLIRERYPTSREWFATYRATRRGKMADIHGRALNYIVKQCGIEGDPRFLGNFLIFSERIYGKDDPYIQEEIEKFNARGGAK